jgi:hypothetical protein
MGTMKIDVEPLAVDATCTDEALRVVLADGREITVPLAWFPRLQRVTPEQRKRWRLIGGGVGLHWEEVDEDPSRVCSRRSPYSSRPSNSPYGGSASPGMF